MQLDETRATNAINWWKYSNEFADKEDEYGTFFAAWIALVILARDYEATYCSQLGLGRGDDQPIQCCFAYAEDIILAAIRRPELKAHRKRLASRHQGEILRTERRKPADKTALRQLSSVWLNDAASDSWELLGLKTLLLQVRNGLFHGSKMYNDSTNRESDDRQLLADLNPILLAIIFTLLDQPGPHTRLLPKVVS
jgi:hypothetical protein